ncbi:Hypothetical predicted protein, partial [Paramuricea clavata]
ADGNCLFHSASILLIGNETLSGILRLLTVSELFAHSDFYGDHPQFTQFAQASGYSQAAIFSILLSDDLASDVYAGNSDNAPHAIESLANTSAKPYVFSSQFHILALASVIRRPIFSVYPDIPGCTAIKNALHCVCYPREGFLENSSLNAADPVHIMWTRANISPLRGWTPNHFAPLIPFRKLHHSTSFEDDVRRGRKKMQKFSFEKSDRNQENLTDKKHLEQTTLPIDCSKNEQFPLNSSNKKRSLLISKQLPVKNSANQMTATKKGSNQATETNNGSNEITATKNRSNETTATKKGSNQTTAANGSNETTAKNNGSNETTAANNGSNETTAANGSNETTAANGSNETTATNNGSNETTATNNGSNETTAANESNETTAANRSNETTATNNG